MSYTNRTAVTGADIDLTFIKQIDYPAIAENQYGNTRAMFSAGRNTQVGMSINRIESNMPLLWSTAYDSNFGEPGHLSATYSYGVSHADYGIRQAGTIAGTEGSEYYEKHAYIDGMAVGFQTLLNGGTHLGSYDEDVLFYFSRQILGDFAGGEATPVLAPSEESDTITFEDELAGLPYYITVPSLASTPENPEALVVFNASYWTSSALAKDWYGAFKIPASGSVTRIALFQADPDGVAWQAPFYTHCRDDTNHYFIRKHPAASGLAADFGALTICTEQAWGEPSSYTNYAIQFSDADLPGSLGELLTDGDASFKFSAIYGTDRGFLLSYRKNVAGTWTPFWALLSKDCTSIQFINATAGDSTATTILGQGAGSANSNAISMMAEGNYAWMIGGTPAVPLIVEATFDEVAAGTDEDIRHRVWTYTLDGHDIAVFRLGPFESLGYDLTTNTWFEPQSVDRDYWRPHVGQNWIGMSTATFANGFGSDIVAGDSETGILWILDPTAGRDDDPDTGEPTAFNRVVTGGIPLSGREVVPCNAVTLGVSLGDPTHTGATITLETSDDGGHTWLNHGSRTITAGEYDAVLEWRSLGQMKAPGRIFRFTDNGAVATFKWADAR